MHVRFPSILNKLPCQPISSLRAIAGRDIPLSARKQSAELEMLALLLPPEWGVFLIALLFLCLLPATMLRLDAALTLPRRKDPATLAFGTDKDGRLYFTDPDGRRWYPPRRSK